VVFDENGHGNEVMKELRGTPILDCGERFLSCWQGLAAIETEVAEIDDQALNDEAGAGDGALLRVRGKLGDHSAVLQEVISRHQAASRSELLSIYLNCG